MLNQTEDFYSSTPVTLEMMPPDSTTPDSEVDVVFTVTANESRLENDTDEMIWSSDCATFVMEYGIIAGVMCGIAFIIGVVFCLFGKYWLTVKSVFSSDRNYSQFLG